MWFVFFTDLGLWAFEGLGNLWGLLSFWSLVSFYEEVFWKTFSVLGLFGKLFSSSEYEELFLFENLDLIFFVSLEIDSVCLFSIRDLICSLKACLASFFGDKISDLFNFGHLLLQIVDIGTGLGDESS